jgi:hypothetical protein
MDYNADRSAVAGAKLAGSIRGILWGADNLPTATDRDEVLNRLRAVLSDYDTERVSE